MKRYSVLTRAVLLSLFCIASIVMSVSAAANYILYSTEMGSDVYGCGRPYQIPCRTYSQAIAQACLYSNQIKEKVFVYDIHYRYGGYCDKVGGGGTEPIEALSGSLYSVTEAILPAASMVVAGFILGYLQMRRKPASVRQPEDKTHSLN